MADKNVQPVWEWKFPHDRHQSFFGRRWVEVHDGVVVEPTDGCSYFRICVLATMLWMLRGAMIVFSPIFKAIIFPFFLVGKGVRWVSPSFTDTAKGVGIRYMASIAKTSGKTGGIQTGPILRLFGRLVLHPVFLGRYSPLRILGRTLLAVVLAIYMVLMGMADRLLADRLASHPSPIRLIRLLRRLWDKYGAYLIIGWVDLMALVALLDPDPITVAIAITVGSISVVVLLGLLLYTFFRSQFGQTVIGRAKAFKHRYCPGIRIVGRDEF